MSDPMMTRVRWKDAWSGALLLAVGDLVLAYAYKAMRNGVPIALWGVGWLVGPLLLLFGGNAIYQTLRKDQ